MQKLLNLLIKRKKTSVFIFLALLIIIGTVTHTIQNTAAYFISLKYKADINRAFDSEFPAVDSYLKDMKVMPEAGDKSAVCDNGPFSSSSPCRKARYVNGVRVSDDFINTWKLKAPQLDKYLLSNGWHIQGSPVKSFGSVFNSTNYNDSNFQIFVSYAKESHKVNCILTVERDEHDKNSLTIAVFEDCDIHSKFES